MPSVKSVAVASTLLALSAAAPTQSHQPQRRSGFQVHQSANPKFHAKNGPAAYAKALSKFGAAAKHVQAVSKAAGGSVDADPEQYDSEYLSPVQISGQTFSLDFDTGSSDLWVFGEDAGVSGHTIYKPGSDAKELSGSTWKISYGDGSSASGNVYTDTVEIGGISVTGQAVEVADTVSAQFGSGAEDGLLGLAFSKINTVQPTPQKTWFDNAVEQGLDAVFAADLQAGSPGKYDFGELDSAYSDITYVDVDSSEGFWTFQPDSVTVGSGSSQKAGSGIADTGTTLLLIEDDIVEAYYGQVDGAQNDSEQGGYVFSCDAELPDFTVTIGGYDAVIPGKYINFAPVDEQETSCFGGIQSSADIGFAIYGDVFLKSQYVVFDQTKGADSPRLGVAAKASS